MTDRTDVKAWDGEGDGDGEVRKCLRMGRVRLAIDRKWLRRFDYWGMEIRVGAVEEGKRRVMKGEKGKREGKEEEKGG